MFVASSFEFSFKGKNSTLVVPSPNVCSKAILEDNSVIICVVNKSSVPIF